MDIGGAFATTQNVNSKVDERRFPALDWNEFMAYQVYKRFESSEKAEELWNKANKVEVDGVERVRVEKPPEIVLGIGVEHMTGIHHADVDEAKAREAVQEATKKVKGVVGFSESAMSDLGALGINVVASAAGATSSAGSAEAGGKDKKPVDVEAVTLAEVRKFKTQIDAIPGNATKHFNLETKMLIGKMLPFVKNGELTDTEFNSFKLDLAKLYGARCVPLVILGAGEQDPAPDPEMKSFTKKEKLLIKTGFEEAADFYNTKINLDDYEEVQEAQKKQITDLGEKIQNILLGDALKCITVEEFFFLGGGRIG